MHRRLQKRDDGISIYTDRHGPEAKRQKVWPFFAKVYFKSPMMKQQVAKMDAPGVEGWIVGHETQPGGLWSGVYLVVALQDYEAGKKRARVFVTKLIKFPKNGDETQAEFPIAEVRNLMKLRKGVDYIERKEKFHVGIGPIEGEEEELPDDQDFDHEEQDIEDGPEEEADAFEIFHEPSKPASSERDKG